jgi:hypothetical protein
MANQETTLLDEILVTSRRKMLSIGAAAFAGLAVGAAPRAASAATYSDADILNFALNLEYLEANFYYLAAFGTTIDKANTASTAAGAPLITLSGTVGTAGTVSGGSLVPFTTIQAGSYARLGPRPSPSRQSISARRSRRLPPRRKYRVVRLSAPTPATMPS